MKNSPKDCKNMDELRIEIDRIDQELMVKLVERVGYIDRAAEIKSVVDLPARIDERVEEVVDNARKNAISAGFDPELAAFIWREMIDWSIAREDKKLKGNSDDSEDN